MRGHTYTDERRRQANAVLDRIDRALDRATAVVEQLIDKKGRKP